ncbi:MAG: ABC transporter permease subunit [Erysipelotrichaceae bacterium]|nr:ABC transporter permease subunit [Erysipelotrichaceae bacterium]
MKKTHAISICLMIIIYSLLSIVVNKTFILPGILEIAFSLKEIVFNVKFLSIVFTSLFRVFIGLLTSFILALLLSLLSYFNKTIKEFFEPVYLLLKTIPNVTYIIVSLLWLGRNGSVLLVSALVVFPILYNSILNALFNIDKELIEITDTYNGSNIYKIRKIYLPLIRNDILLSLKNSCSLGFKVAIMAEILSQVKTGIGRELHFARINYLMADIFAWTIIIIVISYLIDYLLNKLIS